MAWESSLEWETMGEANLESELESVLAEVTSGSPPSLSGRTINAGPLVIVTGRPYQVLNRFAFNGSALTSDHVAILNGIACHIIQTWKTPQPIRTVTLEGHADLFGTDSVNDELGLKRAKTASARLKSLIESRQRGLTSKILFQETSSGKNEPIALSNEPACRALNRRVEIHLLTDNFLPDPPTPFNCVRECEAEERRRLGRPLTRDEEFRLRLRCQRQCQGRPA